MGDVIPFALLNEERKVGVIDPLDVQVESDWISEQEESFLLKQIAALPVSQAGDPGNGRSRIYRYGNGLDYGSHLVSSAFPDFTSGLVQRLDSRRTPRVTSVTINVYQPGTCIRPHKDSRQSGECITVLSLAAPATMRFSDGRTFEMLPRSLFEMEGKARWDLEHEILPVQQHRVSIVFRRT